TGNALGYSVGGGTCGITCSSAGSSVIASATGSVADVAATSAARGNALGSSVGGGTCGIGFSSAGGSVIASATGSVADVAATSAARGNAPGSSLGAARGAFNSVTVLIPPAAGTSRRYLESGESQVCGSIALWKAPPDLTTACNPAREKGADAVNCTEIWRGPPTKPLPCTLLVCDGTTLGLIAAAVAAAGPGGGSSRKCSGKVKILRRMTGTNNAANRR